MTTPPLSTPTAPRMARDEDDWLDGGLTQSLLGQTAEQTTALRSVFAAASRDDTQGPGVRDAPGIGYGADIHEPFPPQAYPNTMRDDHQCACFTSPLSSFLCILGSPFFCVPLLGSCVTVYPKQAVVTTVYGRFFQAFQTPGLYFINPCGRDTQVVTLKTTSVELPSVRVADANGTPVVISAVVVYQVVDPTKAALDVVNLPVFIKTNAHAVLKRVGSLFPYEINTEESLSKESSVRSKVKDLEASSPIAGNGMGGTSQVSSSYLCTAGKTTTRPYTTPVSGLTTGLFEQHASSGTPIRGVGGTPQAGTADDTSPTGSNLSHSAQSRLDGRSQNLSLKTESHLLGDALRELLQVRAELCGIKIVSFELSDLSYAPEVAPMMLARQQAAVWADAKKTIVDASVKICDGAVTKLRDRGIVMSSPEQNTPVTNMMTVLAGETAPHPVIALK